MAKGEAEPDEETQALIKEAEEELAARNAIGEMRRKEEAAKPKKKASAAPKQEEAKPKEAAPAPVAEETKPKEAPKVRRVTKEEAAAKPVPTGRYVEETPQPKQEKTDEEVQRQEAAQKVVQLSEIFKQAFGDRGSKMLTAFVSGKSLAEVAAEFGISESGASKSLKRITGEGKAFADPTTLRNRLMHAAKNLGYSEKQVRALLTERTVEEVEGTGGPPKDATSSWMQPVGPEEQMQAGLSPTGGETGGSTDTTGKNKYDEEKEQDVVEDEEADENTLLAHYYEKAVKSGKSDKEAKTEAEKKLAAHKGKLKKEAQKFATELEKSERLEEPKERGATKEAQLSEEDEELGEDNWMSENDISRYIGDAPYVAWKDLPRDAKEVFLHLVRRIKAGQTRVGQAQESRMDNLQADILTSLAQGATKKIGGLFDKSLPDPTRYSETEAPPKKGMKRAEVRSVLMQLFIAPKRFNDVVTIVQTQKELPDDIVEDAAKSGVKVVRGAARGGRIWIVADNNANEAQLLGVFLHELGVHVGMKNFIGEANIQKLTEQIDKWAAKNDSSVESHLAQRAVTKAGKKENEKIAYFVQFAVEMGIDPTAVQKGSNEFVNWFRTLWAAAKIALRKIGLLNPDKLTAQNVVDLAMGAAELELRAGWHGTAAAFRKFSHAFMGTGEGAQAFGWGTYVAQRGGIGHEYMVSDVKRKTRSRPRDVEFLYDGKAVFPSSINPAERAQYLYSVYNAGMMEETPEQETRRLRRLAERSANDELVKFYDDVLVQLAILDLSKTGYRNRNDIQGSLMRVDMAVADDEWLEWDKPLTEQSDKVQQALGRIFKLDDAVTGEMLYKELVARYGSKKQASVFLDGIGVKGVKFLDQPSRQMRGAYYGNADKPTLSELGLTRLAGEYTYGDEGAVFIVPSNARMGFFRNELFIQTTDVDSDVRSWMPVLGLESKKTGEPVLTDQQVLDTIYAVKQFKPATTYNYVVFNDKNVVRVATKVGGKDEDIVFSAKTDRLKLTGMLKYLFQVAEKELDPAVWQEMFNKKATPSQIAEELFVFYTAPLKTHPQTLREVTRAISTDKLRKQLLRDYEVAKQGGMFPPDQRYALLDFARNPNNIFRAKRGIAYDRASKWRQWWVDAMPLFAAATEENPADVQLAEQMKVKATILARALYRRAMAKDIVDMPAFNKDAVLAAFKEIEKDPGTYTDFFTFYEKAGNGIANTALPTYAKDKEGRWVTSDDKFAIQAVSHPNWCLSRGYAEGYINDGNTIYLFIPKGSNVARLAVLTKNNGREYNQIQNEENDGLISESDYEIVARTFKNAPRWVRQEAPEDAEAFKKELAKVEGVDTNKHINWLREMVMKISKNNFGPYDVLAVARDMDTALGELSLTDDGTLYLKDAPINTFAPWNIQFRSLFQGLTNGIYIMEEAPLSKIRRAAVPSKVLGQASKNVLDMITSIGTTSVETSTSYDHIKPGTVISAGKYKGKKVHRNKWGDIFIEGMYHRPLSAQDMVEAKLLPRHVFQAFDEIDEEELNPQQQQQQWPFSSTGAYIRPEKKPKKNLVLPMKGKTVDELRLYIGGYFGEDGRPEKRERMKRSLLASPEFQAFMEANYIREVRVDELVFSGTELMRSYQNRYELLYGDTEFSSGEEVGPRVGWHGSANKFRTFSHAFMGTGEGRQTEGWGTYVAEERGVAEAYRITLSKNKDGGYLYRVALNISDDSMLDLDASYDAQSDAVKAALKKTGMADFMFPSLASGFKSGRDIYRAVSFAKGSDEAASKFLDSVGIHGAKFLDQANFLGTKDTGTRNLIIYNDKNLVRISTRVGGKDDQVEFSSGDEAVPIVERRIPEIAVTSRQVSRVAKTLGRKALLPLLFGHDLVNYIGDTLPAAKAYFQSMQDKINIRERIELKIKQIATDFTGFSPGVQKEANTFIMDSTMQQKWGFQPEWLGAVVVDPDMDKRFKEFDPGMQKIIKDVFRTNEELFYALEDAVAASATKASLKFKRTKLDGPYASLMRFGDYAVIWKSDAYIEAEGRGAKKEIEKLESDPAHYRVQFVSSALAAERTKAKMERDLGGLADHGELDWFRREFEDRHTTEMPFQAVRRLQAAIEKGPVVGEKYSKEMQDRLTKMANQLYVTSLASMHARKSELHRRRIVGAEPDMMRSFVAHASAMARLVASVEVGDKMADSLQGMRTQAREGKLEERNKKMQVLNEILARHSALLNANDTPWQDSIMLMNSFYTLLTSPAYWMSNTTQPFVMTLPKLAGDHSMGRAWKALITAYKEVSDAIEFKKGRFDPTKVQNTVYKESDALDTLLMRGNIDITIIQDIGDLSDGVYDQFNKMRWLTGNLRKIPHNIEMVNRVASAVSAYRLEFVKQRQADKSEAEAHALAVEYANNIVQDTHGNYGAANAPRLLMQGNKALPVKMMGQFRKFQLIQAALLIKTFNQMFDKGLTPDQQRAARKTMLWLVTNYLTLGGLTGLPAGALLVSALGMLFGDDDDQDDEVVLTRAIGDRDMARLILRGVPAALGVDVSRRLGAGSVFSLMPFAETDPDAKKTFTNYVMAALGPAVGTMGRFADGLGLMLKGQYWKGLELMSPVGATNVSRGVRFATEGVTSRRGDLYMDPEEVGVLSSMFQMVGLPTKAITERQWKQRAVTAYTEHFHSEASRIKSEYVRGTADERAQARKEWKELQEARVKNGFTRQPLSELLKAPQETKKRVAKFKEGVPTTKENARFFATM